MNAIRLVNLDNQMKERFLKGSREKVRTILADIETHYPASPAATSRFANHLFNNIDMRLSSLPKETIEAIIDDGPSPYPNVSIRRLSVFRTVR